MKFSSAAASIALDCGIILRVAAIDPFDCAANELQAFRGASGVRVMPISGTRQMPSTPNAQRSTLNVSMEPLRFEVLGVER